MTELLDAGIPPANGGVGLRIQLGKTVFTSATGLLGWTVDSVAFDFHLESAPNCPLDEVVAGIALLNAAGLEPLPEDECEAELLDNGWTRIYFTPMTAVDDAPLIPSDTVAA